MMRPAALVPALLLAAAAPALAAGPVPPGRSPAAAPVRNGPLPGPLPLFPPTNWWNLDVSRAPLDPASAAFISFVGTARQVHPDFGGDVEGTPDEIYGMPWAVVDGSQAKLAVEFLYSTQSDGVDHDTDTSFPFYPVPAEAIAEARWIEGGPPGNVDLREDSDRHLLIVDSENRHLYELYNVFHDGTGWLGGSGAFFDLSKNGRRPDTWTSADAAGLAILPGLVRYDEADPANTEPIRHAFRVTVRATNGYVWPASHEAGSTAGALPMGARLRLKASKDISGYPAMAQRIFQAMKTYGLIVADNGSDMYVTGTYDTRWDNGVLNPAFHSLTASDFEVVELGWNPPPPVLLWRQGTTGSVAAWVLSGSRLVLAGALPSVADPAWSIVADGDFDGDSQADALWRNENTGENAVWLLAYESAPGRVAGAALPTVAGPAWHLATTGDFDGDSRTDLLWRNGSTGQNAVWLMDGTTIGSAALLPAVPDSSWQPVAAGDLDGDSREDLVWRQASTGAGAVWFLDGATVLSSALLPAVADSAWSVVGAADLDRDGRDDLLWRRAGTGENAAWLMNGATVAGAGLLPTVAGTSWSVAELLDCDLDGRADVVWRDAGTGTNAVWFMEGTGVASSALLPTLAEAGWEPGNAAH